MWKLCNRYVDLCALLDWVVYHWLELQYLKEDGCDGLLLA